MEPAEGFNEWEQIQSPWHQTFSSSTTSSATSGSRTTTQSGTWDDGLAVVITDDYIHNERSVFPATNHEGLPIPPQDHRDPRETSSFSSDSTSSEGDEVGPTSRLRSRLGLISSWVVRLGYGVRNYAECGGGFWSFACVAGVLVVSLVCVKRWRRRRFFRRENEDRLMLLVREKDKEISQLLAQIARMKEILSARRTVPVVRVGRLIAS